MSAKVFWLSGFVVLYWAYCFYWGVRGARAARTASDYFIAGRGVPVVVFVLAATATSFSGWTFVGHPGLIFRDGFPYAFASFYVIAIPLTGVVFLKRQWMLGKRFGYVTAGEMLSDYFRGDAIRLLTVVVALLFAIPYLGVQLRAAGFLFNVLTDGLVPLEAGMWVLTLVVLVYVASGGLRAVAYVDTVQCVLLALGIVVIGMIALDAMGGVQALQAGLARLGASEVGRWGTTKGLGGGDYNAYFAMPGTIQWTAGLGLETPTGGLWTGAMCLSYMLALMGIQSSPAFTMWAFSNRDPKPFAPQQVWASSFAIGLILFVFSAIQGVGGMLLGADPETADLVKDVVPNLDPATGAFLMKDMSGGEQTGLVPHYINLMSEKAPWLVGLLAVAALAAMQSMASAHMASAGGILSRDIYKRYLDPAASHATQKRFGRFGVTFIVIAALLVATFSADALVLLGGLAVAFGLQMWPALAGICYFPWITRRGVTWGIMAGIGTVILTENVGRILTFGLLPWGRWPFTIHSAGWGIAANVLVCVLLSFADRDAGALGQRLRFHAFLRRHTRLPAGKARLRPLAWVLVPAWMFFAFGPGAVIGNDLFGAPDAGVLNWTFGIPSIWAWQILFWLLGVGLMAFLAYGMEMSTLPGREVEALAEDIGDPPDERP